MLGKQRMNKTLAVVLCSEGPKLPPRRLSSHITIGSLANVTAVIG